MGLSEELNGIAEAARRHAEPGEELVAVIPAQPGAGARVFLCAFESPKSRSWLALDEGSRPIVDRGLVRDAVSIAALCELAEETAGGGDLEQLRAGLEELRATENPEGIDDAEEAAAVLAATIEPPPRVASPSYLDRLGGATRHLEHVLGEMGTSPFAETMKQGAASVEGLTADVERGYKLDLE